MAALTSKLKQRTRAAPKRAMTVAARSGKVARWGNSLGVRIPQEIANRLKLKAGAHVSIEAGPDSLTIKPAKPPRKKWTEAELLKGVTPDKVGGEVDWGGPVGKEIW
jgi:antitoxin MazE